MTVRLSRRFQVLVLFGFVLTGLLLSAQTLSTGSLQGTITTVGRTCPRSKNHNH